MKNLIQKLRSAFSFFGTLWTVIGLVGWQASASAILVSIAGWFWAHIQHVPTSLAVMATVPVFVALLYLFKLPGFIRGTAEIAHLTRPNYKVWSLIDHFYIGQAAFLMDEREPMHGPEFMPGNVQANYQLLVQAIRTNVLHGFTPNVPVGQDDHLKAPGAQPNWGTAVKRTDLINYFQSMKNFPLPKFLKR